MASESCDACGDRVRVAGGIADIWTFQHGPSGGLTLELSDGSEHFLCFECAARLPDDPTAADVTALRR